MGTLRLAVLSQDEFEKIHQQSLKILERVGVQVQDSECRDILAKAGAKVDVASDRVYLPSELSTEYLALAPSSIALKRQDGKTFTTGGQNRAYSSLVIDPWIIDYATQKPRWTTPPSRWVP